MIGKCRGCEWWGNETETAACYRPLSPGALVHFERSTPARPHTRLHDAVLVTHQDFSCVQYEPKKGRLLIEAAAKDR